MGGRLGISFAAGFVSVVLPCVLPLVPGYPDINHIQGDAETHFKLVGFNAGVDLPGNVELYSNGTYGTKDAKSYENYRVPNKVVYDPATAAASAAADGLTPPAAGTTIVTYPFPLGFLSMYGMQINPTMIRPGSTTPFARSTTSGGSFS